MPNHIQCRLTAPKFVLDDLKGAELEQARKEAADKARRDAELEAERRADVERQLAEAERRAEEQRKAEAARRLAEAPDKEKLQYFFNEIDCVRCHGLQSERAQEVLEQFMKDLDNALEKVRRFIDG